MALDRSDLIVHVGGECVQKYGTLVRKTSRAEDAGYTFTRGSSASYVGSTGLQWASSGVPRVGYSQGLPVLLLERGATNLVPQTDVQTWGWSGTTGEGSSITTGVKAPDGSATAVTLTDNSTGASRRLNGSPDFALSTAGPWVVSGFVKAGSTAGASQIRLVSTTDGNTNRGHVSITWTSTGGVAGLAAGAGAVLVGATGGLRVGGQWHRVAFRVSSTATIPTRQHEVECVPLSNASLTGSVSFWGPQVEEGHGPTSYISRSTGVAGSGVRQGDDIELSMRVPVQPVTLFAKVVEAGGAAWAVGTSSQVAIAHLGHVSSNTIDPRLEVRHASNGHVQSLYDSGTLAVTAGASTTLPLPSHGDVVEVSADVDSAGGVRHSEKVGAAAESQTPRSAAAGIPATKWGGGSETLNIGQRGDSGRAVVEVYSVKLARGVKSLGEMRNL